MQHWNLFFILMFTLTVVPILLPYAIRFSDYIEARIVNAYNNIKARLLIKKGE